MAHGRIFAEVTRACVCANAANLYFAGKSQQRDRLAQAGINTCQHIFACSQCRQRGAGDGYLQILTEPCTQRMQHGSTATA